MGAMRPAGGVLNRLPRHVAVIPAGKREVQVPDIVAISRSSGQATRRARAPLPDHKRLQHVIEAALLCQSISQGDLLHRPVRRIADRSHVGRRIRAHFAAQRVRAAEAVVAGGHHCAGRHRHREDLVDQIIAVCDRVWRSGLVCVAAVARPSAQP